MRRVGRADGLDHPFSLVVGRREVDDNIEVVRHLFQVVTDGNAEPAYAGQLAGIGTDEARAGTLGGCAERQ